MTWRQALARRLDKRLPGARAADKAGPSNFAEPSMIAIGVIALFIIVMAVLNRIEFGRFD